MRERALLKRTPLKSQMNQDGKGSDLSDPGLSWPDSDSDRQVKKEASAPPQIHRRVPVGRTLAAAPDDQQPPSSAQTFHLRKRPLVFAPFWERGQRRHTQEEHRNSKYELDLKVRHQFSPCCLSQTAGLQLFGRDKKIRWKTLIEHLS